MEPAEDPSLEAAILWLVGTILGTLLIDKLDEWIGQVGLTGDVRKLKSEIQRVKMMIAGVKGRALGNEPLAEALSITKELLYDADDVVDELDYYRLQQQVEGVTRDEPEGVKRIRTERSPIWKLFRYVEEDGGKPAMAFCNYCENQYVYKPASGTSTMITHAKGKHGDIWAEAEAKAKAEPPLPKTKKPPRASTNKPRARSPNPSSTGAPPGNATLVEAGNSSGRKRRRTDEEPAQTTPANTYTPWDRAELSSRIKTVTSQLQGILETLNKDLKQHGSGSASTSNHHLSTSADKHPTSSLVPGKVYGRVAEKDFIIKLITEDQSDVVTVLPIAGIAGVGKTALAQLVYSDPKVKSQFHHRIWVWVSHNFDEVRITREMLDFVSPKTNEGSSHRNERHEGVSSFAKLQEILKENMEYQGHTDDPLKKFLLILDDVWDILDDDQCNKLLAPLIESQMKGNVILVTTRNLTVAKRLGTLKPVKLSALPDDDFWLLFKSRAFGNENYEGNQSLCIIGRQIVQKLMGNPLAAETAGALLRKDLTVDHWNSILKEEDWKSLQLSRGIMPAIKLSYDQLPFHLQQCYSYTSIFPSSYQFRGKELVSIWISQGFVKKCSHSSKILEEIGQYYLTELVNLGFFQQVEEKKEISLGSEICYSVCGLMHAFARMFSRTECAIIDGLQCNKMLPTIRHLSIVTDSAYNSEDPHRNIPRKKKFEENLRNTVTSVGKLRSLVLLGYYDSSFFQVLQDIFHKAKNLRLLQTSAKCADFNSLMCSLSDPTHLRYLKRESSDVGLGFSHVLSKLYHLEVLDVGSYIDSDGINNLVSVRHLVVDRGVYSSISSIGNMTSLQELHKFNVQDFSSGFEMAQLQSMNELVQLGLCGLDSVKTHEEACGARLGDKVHLGKLHLSWNDYLADEEYASSESSEEFLPTDDGGPRSEPSVDAAEVLEGLEPHKDLKHLWISGYNGTTSPTWLAKNISVTSLQTLHLDCCGGWRILPSLEILPFLTMLKLSRMWEVTEVLVPSLEELVLTKMPKLERCSSTSVEGLSSNLRVLKIKNCHVLKEFDIFENNNELETMQRSWLPGLRKLTLRDCPDLEVLKPLPPSATVSELLIRGVSRLVNMKVSSSEDLSIGYIRPIDFLYGSSGNLRILDDKILAFHSLRNIKSMRIEGCQNLTYISFKGFSHLVSLKSLKISMCNQLFSSDVMPEHTPEDGTAANDKAFPSLESLSIKSCGITGKWLCLLLKCAPDLKELHLAEEDEDEDEDEEIRQSNRMSDWEDSSSGEQDDALSGLAQDRLVHIPLNLIASLRKISIVYWPRLTFYWSEVVFPYPVLTSLQELKFLGCSLELLSSLVHKDRNDNQANGRCFLPASLKEIEISLSYSEKTLQPCFLGVVTDLRKLTVRNSLALEYLQLCSCTSLEELTIRNCRSLTMLDGLQSLVSLRHLFVHDCSHLVLKDGSEDEQEMGRWLLPKSLWELEISGCSQKTVQLCFPSDDTSLKKLHVQDWADLESLQLRSCTALEELTIWNCGSLTALEGLQFLGSLRHLKVSYCSLLSPCLESCSRQGYELFPRLETLLIDDSSVLTTSFCNQLISLQRLKLRSLTQEQGAALVLPTSLQDLEFVHCYHLVDLPAGLDLLPSLKRLKIGSCERISRLPETGLPLSLEELEIERCSKELADGCRALKSSKLNVKISHWLN